MTLRLILNVCYQRILEVFSFELGSFLNKFVKVCSSFYQKNYFEQKFKVLYIHLKNEPIPDFGVSSSILNITDISGRGCKLNFGRMRGHVKP